MRSLSTIIIPLIVSIILLNDCGRGWTYLWKQCHGDQNREQLHNVVPMTVKSKVDPLNPFSDRHDFCNFQIEISNYETICGFQSITSNKCIRQFLYSWSYVITEKLLIMVFMPFIVKHKSHTHAPSSANESHNI